MLEQSLQDKIDVYLKPGYIEVVENECELWEMESSGRTKLKVILPANTSILCIRNHDNQPRCQFLNPSSDCGLTKSVDHILLTPNQNGSWTAHLIEMKSTVEREKWHDIGLKARASMLNMKAAAAVLDIPVDSFKVYTTYGRLSHFIDDQTNLAGRKTMLGGDWKENEWDKNKIPIYIPRGQKIYLWHNGIKMKKEVVDNKDTLCGELTLA